MRSVWIAEPTIRLRPVPELACCLAYLPPRRDPPRRPELHGLNLTSWLVLSLCDGRDDEALQSEFAEAMAESAGPGADPDALALALQQLSDLGLINRIMQEQPP
jgi:hypothetical protein